MTVLLFIISSEKFFSSLFIASIDTIMVLKKMFFFLQDLADRKTCTR